jgi:hypothetical protein
MKIKDIISESSTTSGSIAPSVTSNMPTISRGGNLLKGKTTSKKFANTPKKINEAEISEEELLLLPGISKKKNKSGFIPREQDRTDHEVEMARSDLIALAKNTKTVFNCIKNISEEEGIEGWVQEKIIKSSDYMNTLAEYLEGKQYSDEHDCGCEGECDCDDNLTENTMPLQNAVDSALNIVKQFKNADMHIDIITQITNLAKQAGIDAGKNSSLDFAISDVLEKQRELESAIYSLVDVFKDELYLRNNKDELDESKKKSKDNKYAIGMAVAKKEAGYGKKPAHDLPKSVIKKAHKIAKNI